MGFLLLLVSLPKVMLKVMLKYLVLHSSNYFIQPTQSSSPLCTQVCTSTLRFVPILHSVALSLTLYQPAAFSKNTPILSGVCTRLALAYNNTIKLTYLTKNIVFCHIQKVVVKFFQVIIYSRLLVASYLYLHFYL